MKPGRLQAQTRNVARHAHNAALKRATPLLQTSKRRELALVLGTGRSGTTALMSAIAAGWSAEPLFEPLRPEECVEARACLSAHGYALASKDAEAPALSRYVSEISQLRHLTRWSTSRTTVLALRSAKRIVIKEVRANRAAGWLQQQLPGAPLFSIVRHPLRVVHSMQSAAVGWSTFPFEWLVPPAAEALNCEPRDLCSPHDPPALWLFALWLADTKRLISDLKFDQIDRSVFYENFSSHPEKCIERITMDLKSFDTIRASRVARSPSTTASSALGREPAPLTDLFNSSLLARMDRLTDKFDVRLYDLAVDQPLATTPLRQ